MGKDKHPYHDSRKSTAEIRQSLADPHYTAQEYEIDQTIAQGPLHNRRCTDVLCLIIFLVALVGGGYIGIYALENGDPAEIMRPMDADGNLCGKDKVAGDQNFVDYPYLYYVNIDTQLWLPYSVCVSSCPKTAEDLVHCIPTTLV